MVQQEFILHQLILFYNDLNDQLIFATMKQLQQQLSGLQSHISHYELLNPLVSQASVGWHIEHSLLVINGIIKTLQTSDPTKYHRTFNLRKTLVLLVGTFPRGRAKAPESVTPQSYDKATLLTHAATTENKLKELEMISAGQFFKHPLFGHLKVKAAIRFIGIHTKHHLDIIEDIVKK